jgi:hypothetical protein
MIALKALLLGVGFSMLGTIAYVVFLIWYSLRGTPLFQTGGSVGFDITSLAHNTYLAPAYWLFIVGLFATGCAIVFLWPGPVVPPPQ